VRITGCFFACCVSLRRTVLRARILRPMVFSLFRRSGPPPHGAMAGVSPLDKSDVTIPGTAAQYPKIGYSKIGYCVRACAGVTIW
jgi:hypothetical protein